MQTDKLEVLDIRVARARDSGYSVVMRLGEREFPVGAIDAGIVAAVAEASPNDQGARLFAAFTADERVRMAWNLAAALAPRRRIRLRIEDDAPELHPLPWEALRDASPTATAREPGADRDTPFSRLVPCAWDLLPAVDGRPLRILSAVAAPTGLESYQLPPIDRAGEQASLVEALAAGPPGLVQHTPLAGPCSLAGLEAALEHGHHALHLVAHGVVRRDGEVALFLEGADGSVDRVDGSSFAAMLERLDRTLRLLVLMVCSSATRSPGDVEAGLAPKLLAAGVPAVLAMQDLMPIDTGRAFTRAFYGQLLTSGEVDRAANRARATLLTGRLRGSAVPVLYSALAGNRLFTADVTRTPSRGEVPTIARSATGGEVPTIAAPAPETRGERPTNVTPAPAPESRGETPAQSQAGPEAHGEAPTIVTPPAKAEPARAAGPRPPMTTTGPGDRWRAWEQLDGHVGKITAARGRDGCIELFAIDADGDTLHGRRQSSPGGPFGAWEYIGDQTAQVETVVDDRGRISVIVVDHKGACWRALRTGPNAWADWETLGGAGAEQLTTACGCDGCLSVYVVGRDGKIKSREQNDGFASWFRWENDWEEDDERHLQIVAVRDGQALIMLFSLRTDHTLWAAQQDSEAEFSDWRRLGAQIERFTVVADEAGRLQVLALDEHGGLRHCGQLGPGGEWSAWKQLGGEQHQVVAVQRKHGGLEVFTLTADGALRCIVEQGDGFAAWTAIDGPPLAQVVALENGKGELELLAVDQAGALHRRVARALTRS